MRLLLSADEAFCFKNLMLNSYPHVNVTLDPSNQFAVTSFTATSLKRGNFSVTIELWVDGERTGVELIPLKVNKGFYLSRCSVFFFLVLKVIFIKICFLVNKDFYLSRRSVFFSFKAYFLLKLVF